MKYGVKIKNYLKGMYEIAIFNNKKEAEKCFERLSCLWNDELDSETLSIEYENALNNVISYIDYWECRNIGFDSNTVKINNLEYSVNNNGKVSKEISNITFVFNGNYAYVPA